VGDLPLSQRQPVEAQHLVATLLAAGAADSATPSTGAIVS